MTRSPDDLVAEFCALWSNPDPARIASYFTEDGVYHNIPMEAVHGPAAIEEFISGFLTQFDGIDFTVHRQVANGALVFNERTDLMRRKDGKVIALPVTGVFEIEGDRILAWRDYFDMGTVAKSFA